MICVGEDVLVFVQFEISNAWVVSYSGLGDLWRSATIRLSSWLLKLGW